MAPPQKNRYASGASSSRLRPNSSNDESPPPIHFDRSRFHSIKHESHYSRISQKPLLSKRRMELRPRDNDDDKDEEQQIRRAKDAVMHDEDEQD
ncbi:hypothetical protein VNO78_10830 [Psophocarpus tetragonolobus]|uniref:Uncharacterized protein n=1 Tax=Psophocarpus tetragonolobus TaxID=3891 RepID=A0AAN9SS28_PSOTE